MLDALALCLLPAVLGAPADALPYPIVDTAQVRSYDDRTEIRAPKPGAPWFGQDASYAGNAPRYRDNGDGTVSDLVTGLMWQKDPGTKRVLRAALEHVRECRLAGHRDWRVPSIKELYSLILFTGIDPDPMARATSELRPFLDTRFFTFRYGDPAKGERIIDSQYGSSTRYVATTMGGNPTVFGVNFADGRIKGYPESSPRGQKTFYFLYVRANPRYGKNDFVDNGDGTITDRATGLTWTQVDSGELRAGEKGGMPWKDALAWAESLEYADHTDWRLPNAKELQSIVDYRRSPPTTCSPAANPLFRLSRIVDEGGDPNWPCYWTSTTHARRTDASAADYIAFGTALGWMPTREAGVTKLLDVHGAGCQRSDPKSGDPTRFPRGRGPQGDVVRILNHALCCRGGPARVVTSGPEIEMKGSGASPGQPGGRPGGRQPSGEGFVRRLDRDGDGRVSRREFDGPAEHFRRLDENGDGYLTADEAPTGPPPRRR